MIPKNIWATLTDSLLEQRTDPCLANDRRLWEDEIRAGFPYNASPDQLAEHQNICDRTRTEFEYKVNELKRTQMGERLYHKGDKVQLRDEPMFPQRKDILTVIDETTITPNISSVPHYRINAKNDDGSFSAEAAEYQFIKV